MHNDCGSSGGFTTITTCGFTGCGFAGDCFAGGGFFVGCSFPDDGFAGFAGGGFAGGGFAGGGFAGDDFDFFLLRTHYSIILHMHVCMYVCMCACMRVNVWSFVCVMQCEHWGNSVCVSHLYSVDKVVNEGAEICNACLLI